MVILDNGHGIDTKGKISPIWSDGTQLFEYEFTRDIVKRIHVSLLKRNIASTILVPELIDVPLIERVSRANKLAVENVGSFVVSIHGNAGEQPNQGTGWEVWTSPGESKSDKIATRLFMSAQTNLSQFKMRTDFIDSDPDKESKFYILVRTWCPAVLTENLFYDNELDCKFMLSEEGRFLIANLHLEGITKYLLP